MDLSDLKILSLFVDNECWQRINTYFSKPVIKYNTPEYIFSELKNYLKRYKIKEFEFVDFCNIDLVLLGRFCGLIRRYKLKIHWSAKAIINPGMREAAFRKMKLAGCRKLIFEIITGSDKLLRKMGLNFSTKDISLLLRLAHQNGITVGINLILGFPLETDEDYDETLGFLTENSSIIDEITKITCCLSNYSQKKTFPFTFPFCRYWKQCLGLKRNDNIGFLKEDYKTYLSGISKLEIPIVNIEPNPHILDYIRNLIKPYSLERKELSFFFDNGKGRLFWKNRELTKGLGLYTSIFSSGFWQDSEGADWQITKVSEEKMILRGKWRSLPIIQVWEIELTEDTGIIWKIEMEVFEDVIIEGEQQTNVMLTNEYETWLTEDGSRDSFTNSFNEEWITLFERGADVIKSVSAINPTHRLPSISLKYNKLGVDYYLSILNTSSSFCARKLKCYKIKRNDKKYTPGKYLYFNGKIEVGD